MKNNSFGNYLAIASIATVFTSFTPTTFAQQDGLLEEIIVTAQRRAENIQDVPIAVSAFGSDEMKMRRMDDGRDLQLAVPNLSFTGGNNFQIRGVGDSVGGVTGDVGVGIHRNNIPQVLSRIVTAETYDIDRIEVLRGPQGTLYGRNSTGGVINYITTKPKFDENSFNISAEVGNYSNQKLKGMANLPLGELFALRLAGSTLSRDGYTKNEATGNDIDDRDLYSVRATLGFEPTDSIRAWVLYEKFSEDDHRRSGARTLCINDPGPTQVGSTTVTNPIIQGFLSQGCSPGSLYADNAFAHPNSVGTFGGRFAHLLSFLSLDPNSGVPQVLPFSGDLFAAQSQSTDLRRTSEYFDPETTIDQEIIEFEVNADIGDSLTLSMLAHQSNDESYLRFGSYEGAIQFLDTAVTPGGIWTDFQHGPANSMRTLSITDDKTEQQSIELRLQSDFDGPINFNIGGLIYDVERDNHVFVTTNTTTLYLGATTCAASGPTTCAIFHDTNPTPDYSGHQYFDTYTPYDLTSKALFTEFYFDLSDTVKLTTGLRYTDDEKERLNLEIQLLAPEGANGIGTGGYPAAAQRTDTIDFQEVTGRVVLDWMPDLGFSDSTLIYGSFSRGYKAGGFNSPEQGVSTIVPYDPELVNAYEIGTKNTFAGGRAQLNASLFYYDYQDYQISKIEQFSSRNENVDAEVFGLEIESQFEPVDNLALSVNLGWLKTEISNGSSVDPLNRTAGDPNFTVLKTFQTGCVAPTAVVEGIIGLIEDSTIPPTALFDPCGNAALGGPFPSGVEQDLSGNELPNSPELSASFGAQYSFTIGDNWDSIVRLDYSWKDDSYASVFNGESYQLESWDNANITLLANNFESGIGLQFFVKNIFDDDTIVNYSTGSDGLGLARSLTLLDPRLFGAGISYEF